MANNQNRKAALIVAHSRGVMFSTIGTPRTDHLFVGATQATVTTIFQVPNLVHVHPDSRKNSPRRTRRFYFVPVVKSQKMGDLFLRRKYHARSRCTTLATADEIYGGSV